MDTPLVAIVGTVTMVGPLELAPQDTTYEWIIIRDPSNEPRAFSMVQAAPGVSQLLQPQTSGLFVLKHTREETRLLCAVCEDGRLAVDFDALRKMAA
jgi:hypothetical protein